MGAIDIGIRGGCRPCAMRLDLDQERPHEGNILRHVGRGQFYEPDVAEVFLRVLREGDTVVDVGCNAGFFTMLAAALVGPHGRVLGFEPDPASHARLVQNAALNGFDHVTLVDRPALAQAGTVDFHINSDDSGGSALWDPGQWPGNVRTRAAPTILSFAGTTIDAEVARLGLGDVRLLKIDTEGADHEVLRGAAGLLADGGIPFVVCELHEFGLRQMGSSQAALRTHMAGLGYDGFMLQYDGSLPRLVPLETEIRTGYICNILFSSRRAVGACWPAYHHDPGSLER